MKFNKNDTALVVTDPQNDFLSKQGAVWKLVGESVEGNGTVGNLEKLFRAAKAAGIKVFVSPHYYYPTDHDWESDTGGHPRKEDARDRYV